MGHVFTRRLGLLFILQPWVACTPRAVVQVPAASIEPAQQSAASSKPPPILAPGYSSFAFEMPSAVTSFGAAALGKHVYVLGGYAGEPHHYTKEGQSDAFTRLDVETGAWQTLTPLGKIQSATLDPIGNKLIRVGGTRVDNGADAAIDLHTVPDVDLFDPQTAAWTKATALPEPRSSHGTAIIEDKIYVIGGWNLNGAMDSGTWASTMLIGQLKDGQITWTSQPVALRSRALAVAAIGREIVAVGGIEGRRVQRTTHIFDTQTNTWSIGPEFPEPAFGVAMARMGEHLFASGASGIVYVLNAARSAWEPYSQLTFPRFFHSMVASNERLLFLGGVPSTHAGDRVRHIEQVTREKVGITSFTVENASPAKNRQGIFLAGNGLYVFGGNKALGQHDFAQTNFLQDSYRLDLGSFAWTKLNPFPNAAQSMQAIVTSTGLGVASGGFGPQGNTLTSSREVMHYDLETDTWSKAGTFPESRTQFGFAEYDKELWVFGGMTFDDSRKDGQFAYPRSVLHRKVDSTDPFTPSEISTPRERRAFAWATLDEHFYMIGGMAEGFGLVSQCDAFDFRHKSWLTVPCPSRVRIGAEMVALDDKLYLIAGRSRPTPEAELADDPRIEVYDPKTRTWSTILEKLPMADSHQLRAFAFGDKLLLYTAQREDRLVQLLLIDPKQLPPASGSTAPN